MAALMRYLIARIRYALAGCDFNHPSGSTIRTCPVCGCREELDINDGASLNAWYTLRPGDKAAHFRHLSKSALPSVGRTGVPAATPRPEFDAGEHEPISTAK